LSRQKQYDLALDSCESLLSDNPGPLLIATAISIGRAEDLDSAQLKRTEILIEQIGGMYPTDAAVQWQLASYYVAQGNLQKGTTRYRSVLEHDPNHVIALNNLAWLLSHGKTAELVEAKQLIQAAIDLAGPVPQLLDTQATILTVAGENQKAVEVLQAAIEETDTSVMQFHLAVAYWKMENRSAAVFHFKKALESGLVEDDLHDLEKNDFQALFTQIGDS
jgi:tetratricopeptide (TPR) repeat protein